MFMYTLKKIDLMKLGLKAFTLSEVMLVLSVIGVVAALTIPGIIQNLNELGYKTTYKKAFANANQVFQRASNEGMKGIMG